MANSRKSTYTFDDAFGEKWIDFNMDSCDKDGNDLVAAVVITDISGSSISISKEEAIAMAKAILGEANTTFETWDLDNFHDSYKGAISGS